MYVADASSQDIHVHRCRASADICCAAIAGVCGAVRVVDRERAVLARRARPHLGGTTAIGIRVDTAELSLLPFAERDGGGTNGYRQGSSGEQGAHGGAYAAGGASLAVVV